MKCIINASVILADRVERGLAIVFDEKIRKILSASQIDEQDYEIIDANNNYLAPGLVDIHIHGYLGADVSDGSVEGIKTMAEGIAKNGVTAWCPTTMTVSKEEIEAALSAVRTVKNSEECYGARILGVHAEGPFINSSKKGAQAAEHILAPNADFVLKNKDIIKILTIAPEVEGAKECIKKVSQESKILISMGHTDATFEEANAGIEAGVRHTTHLFNAMSPLTHRNPGVVGAALSDDKVSCELIADTFHVSKELFGFVSKVKGEKLCLITDCIRAGGMEDGDYTLGGQPVHKEGIKCLMPDGTIAGSVLKLNEAVKNLFDNTELTLAESMACATLNPAKAIGADKEIGSIDMGKRADFIIMDENFNVLTTIVGGKVVYEETK